MAGEPASLVIAWPLLFAHLHPARGDQRPCPQPAKNHLQLAHENFNQLKTYQHLASYDLKPLLKEYIELFDNETKNVSTEHGEALSLKHINPEFQEKIRAQIREDYDSLVEKLYNIHK